jgi:hypothetical protein
VRKHIERQQKPAVFGENSLAVRIPKPLAEDASGVLIGAFVGLSSFANCRAKPL